MRVEWQAPVVLGPQRTQGFTSHRQFMLVVVQAFAPPNDRTQDGHADERIATLDRY
jgi:hypothetical protein